MIFGAIFPQTEIEPDPIVIRDYAQAVEGMGYRYLLAFDHVLGANPVRPGGWHGPYTHRDSFHEPLVLFAYLAGLTDYLEFATGILILPQRQAVLVAKQAAQVDVLSGGRLRLGVGIGWNRVEYEALDMEFGNRGKRIEEQIAVLNQLWTEPLVTFDGKHHHISDAGLNPLPVQQPIPIWFGGYAEPVLKRMARLGEGWVLTLRNAADAAAPIERLYGYLQAEGRDPADFGLECFFRLNNTPPADWEQELAAWRDVGITHVAVNTMGAGLESTQAHLDLLQKFIKTQ